MPRSGSSALHGMNPNYKKSTLEIFLLFLKETSHEPLKVAAAEKSLVQSLIQLASTNVFYFM